MKTYAPVTEEVIEALKGVVGAEYVLPRKLRKL